MPTTPHSEAGWRTLPPVSDPSAPRHSSAATAAALPPLDPPGTRVRSHGLRVVKKAEFSVDEPMANSSVLVLPTITAPAARSLRITVASKGGTKSSKIFEPHVAGTPSTRITSLIAKGIPSKAGNSAPSSASANALSAAAASSSAASGSTVRYALTALSTA